MTSTLSTRRLHPTHCLICAQVTGTILEYLYKPTAADKRDERSYKQFRRRPRNSMTMDPFEAFENGGTPAMGLIGAMMLPMFFNPGGTGFFQRGGMGM